MAAPEGVDLAQGSARNMLTLMLAQVERRRGCQLPAGTFERAYEAMPGSSYGSQRVDVRAAALAALRAP